MASLTLLAEVKLHVIVCTHGIRYFHIQNRARVRSQSERPLCVEFACSPYVCGGFLSWFWVLV